MELRIYLAQRISALVMVPLVIGHIAVMIHAVRGGLTAGEILSRTQGSVGWASFYGLFVIAASVHAAIGLRNIAGEWTSMRPRQIDGSCLLIFVILIAMGLRAVYAVTVGPGA